MADFKRRTLLLSSGKQIKLFGNSIAIGKSLEIGEGYAPNIFSCVAEQAPTKTPGAISNVVSSATSVYSWVFDCGSRFCTCAPVLLLLLKLPETEMLLLPAAIVTKTKLLSIIDAINLKSNI